MPTVPIGLAGPSYVAEALSADCEQTLNFIPEVIESERGITKLYLLPTPGLKLFMDKTGISTGGVRGCMRYQGTTGIVVIGSDVYTVTTAGVGTNIGSVVNDGNPVRMFANVVGQVAIRSAGLLYVIASNVVTLVSDPDLSPSIDAEYLDGYAVSIKTTNQQFQISSNNDFTLWDSLEFATLEAVEDVQMAVIRNRLELWFLGQKNSQIYYDSGNLDFPIERRPGGIIEQGCIASNSTALVDQAIMWLSGDENGFGIVVEAVGYQTNRVSSEALEYAIRSYSTITDAVGFPQLDRGQYLYWLWFPTADHTWVYSRKTKLWHERSYWDTVTATHRAHRASCSMTLGNKLIVGDRENPILYEMSNTTYTDNTAAIMRERTCQHIVKQSRAGGRRTAHKSLRLIADVGVGLAVASTASGFDPQITLYFSDDGAKTFPWSEQRSLGKLGAYQTVIEWQELGSTDVSRVYRIRCSEPVPIRLIEAFLDVG